MSLFNATDDEKFLGMAQNATKKIRPRQIANRAPFFRNCDGMVHAFGPKIGII